MIDLRKKLLRFLPLTFDQVAPQHKIDIGRYVVLPEGFHAANPSIAAIEDGYIACIRCVNYVYTGTGMDIRFTTGTQFMTLNRFLLLDNAFQLRRTLPALDNSFDNVEDIKLFTFESAIMGVGSCEDPKQGGNARSIGLLTIDPGFERGHCRLMASPFSLKYEKNWAPFVHDGVLHFIYSFSPLIILRYDPATGSTTFAGSQFERFTREDLKFLVGGSSAGLPVPGGFLFVAHRRRVSLPRFHRHYVSRLCRLETAGMTMTEGRFFSLGPPTIQFINGLVRSEDDLVFAYGEMEHSANLCRVPMAQLVP